MYINLNKIKESGYYGVAIIVATISVCIGLLYFSLHNPYKDLHARIFEIAAKVNNYYREKPNYWKLTTQTADEDNLIGEIRSDYAEYDFSIGQGVNGDGGLPSDITFDIALKNLGKSACIALSEFELSEQQSLSLLKISIITEEKVTEFSWGGENKLPIRKYDARNICAGNRNTIVWTFQ